MRLLFEFPYGTDILTADLTDQEICVLIRAFDKAITVKKEGWGDTSKLTITDERLPELRFVGTTSKILPEFDLRVSVKQVMAEEAAKEPVIIEEI